MSDEPESPAMRALRERLSEAELEIQEAETMLRIAKGKREAVKAVFYAVEREESLARTIAKRGEVAAR